jgi:hypothetical protein
MHVKTITLTGATGCWATIERVSTRGGECIGVRIFNRDGTLGRTHAVATDDREDQFSMAELLQPQLDGYNGTNSEIHDVFNYITLFAD